MDTTLDCIPCFLRQTLDAARFAGSDPAMHEHVLRRVVQWLGDADLRRSPPLFARDIHRLLRELTGNPDPYAEAKERFNRLALGMLPDLAQGVARAPDPPGPLDAAVRLAIAGNTIDLGVNGSLTEDEARLALDQALARPVDGDMRAFSRAVATAGEILYLADNAGEIVLDGLLVQQLAHQLGPGAVTVVVRGAPVLNDATLADAETARLTDLARVMDNGSDAPGTVLEDCSPALVERFERADMIIAKGQGNFESLAGHHGPIFFLFKVKCPVVAARTGRPVGTHLLLGPDAPSGPRTGP